MCEYSWTRCDSRSDLNARLSSVDCQIFDELRTEDESAWGYLYLKDENICIPVAFCDIGLLPQILVLKNVIFIGISDTVAGYALEAGVLLFKYKVPTVFHEFVGVVDEMIVVQDETGFIGLSSSDGSQQWIELCDDIIDSYHLSGNAISGKTTDGEEFKFVVA